MKDYHRDRGSDYGSFIVDAYGTILGFDQDLEELTGWPAVEIVGRPKDDLFHAERPQSLYDGSIPATDTAKTLDLTLHCRDRRHCEVEALAQHLPGPGERMLVTILRVLTRSAEDVSGLEHYGRDGLTGLRDHSAFESQLRTDTRDALNTGRPLALILGDIDHLRHFNQRYGEGVGDEILHQIAGILRVQVDDEARIFRLQEDDFAVLLTNAGRGEARQVAAAIRSTVDRQRIHARNDLQDELHVTMTLGAASVPTDAETDTDLVERANDALEEARLMGRNRVWCYLRRPRIPLQVPVFFDGSESLFVGYTRDLSPSGIFVQTSVPIDIGMRCALTFPLPGADGRVRVVGKVVRTVPPSVSVESADVRIPGIGVEFERFGRSADRRAIDAYLHGQETLTLRPETGPFSVKS